ncbi:MAG: HNH endonuclease [Pseudonocardiales bacterium]|nr:MAG: HNH endonuclease [Pseudonocardiales bacterium]
MNESVEWDDEPPEPPEPRPYLPTVMDAAACPDDVVAWAATVTPGSAPTTPLAVIDPRRLSHEGLVDFIAACERHVSWFLAMQYEALAVMAEDPTVPTLPGERDKDWVREEVACALKLSFNTAAGRLQLAKELTGRLPATLDLQHRGEISTHHSRSVAEATMSLDAVAATKVEQAVLAKAPEQSLTSFRRSLRRAVLTAAPQSAEKRHAKGMAERRVVRMPTDDTGMSGIWMLLPDAGATVVMTAIDALARWVTPGDPRTADQRRADAVIQLALDTLHGSSSGELPREHGMRPTIHVCVALSTLLGVDDQPGELAGSGPIPATLARTLAADPTGTWRRLVTDPLGKLIDYGHDVYRPPKHLADHVIARDRTCRFPLCNRQACHCDLDHLQPWERDGPTNEANLQTVCCRHHHAKHQAGWTPQRLPDGSIEWTSPTGHTYRDEQRTYPIDRTMQISRVREH